MGGEGPDGRGRSCVRKQRSLKFSKGATGGSGPAWQEVILSWECCYCIFVVL